MPIPTVTSRRASTMALDLTCLTTLQANASASTSSGVGAHRVLLERFQRGRSIQQVVVGELLALQLLGRGQRRLRRLRNRGVEGGALVRVLAVPQRLQPPVFGQRR